MSVNFSLLQPPQDIMKGNRAFDYVQQGQQTGLNTQQSQLNNLTIQKQQNDLAVQPQLNNQAVAINQANLDKTNFDQKKQQIDLIANAAGSLVNLPDDNAVNQAYQTNILPTLKNVIPNMPETMTKGQAQAYYSSAITAQNQLNASITQQRNQQLMSMPQSGAGKTQYDIDRKLVTPEQAAQFEQNKATRVNINNNPENKGAVAEQVEQAKLNVRNYDGIRTNANNSANTLNQLYALKNIQYQTGALEPYKATAASFVQALGFDPKTVGLQNASNAQSINAITSNLVLQKQLAQKGVQSESDAKRMKDTIARLGNTQQAFKFINNFAIEGEKRNIEMADFYAKWYEDNKTYQGADKAWREFAVQTPIIGNKTNNDGVPITYFDFKAAFKQRNPEATDQDAIDFWRHNYTDNTQDSKKKTMTSTSAREAILR
jgi:hypothetical protein